MGEKRKSRSIPFIFFLLGVVFLPIGCSDDEDHDHLTVQAIPNPVTGVVQGRQKRWDFTVTITNQTQKRVTITGYYGEVLDTDTGCTNPRELHTNKPYTGVTIAPEGAYSYEAGFVSTCFGSGENVRDYEGVTDDGETVSGRVQISFR